MNEIKFILIICIILNYQWTNGSKLHRIHDHGYIRPTSNDEISPDVALGMEAPYQESGPWGPWSIFSPCSRPCGGGVKHRTRLCSDAEENYSGSCIGPNKQYVSCNIEKCIDNSSFRAAQCSGFNSVPIEGKYYDWVPYPNARNPCELNCMVKDGEFYYKHAKQVVDGTPCYEDDELQICVEGICIRTGCDRLLGSKAAEDLCRVCKGDGSTCKTYKDVYNLNNLRTGYNDIILIPEGATYIEIRETKPSNFLSLRDSQGKYVLNADWHIDFSKDFTAAGATFHYQRHANSEIPEFLSAIGPTTEPLIVSLIFQETNPGVFYEFSSPFEVNITQIIPGEYIWWASDFGECSTKCGSGIQVRNVECIKARTKEPVLPFLCNKNELPENKRICNTDPCGPDWFVGEWSPCYCPGLQTRNVYCHRIIKTDEHVFELPESACLSQSSKPIQVQDCRESNCISLDNTTSSSSCDSQYQWVSTSWSKCDARCGEGIKTRESQCQDATGKKVENIYCDHLPRPSDSETCNEIPCDSFTDWIATEWSSCDVSCGASISTREVFCGTEKGVIYSEELCDAHRRFETNRICESYSGCGYQWFTSEWSSCSVNCGRGIRTRHVFCALYDDDKITISKNENCNEVMPVSQEECFNETCESMWLLSHWGMCEGNCETGTRSRYAVCHKTDEEIECSEDKPIVEETCLLDKACDGDSDSCGATDIATTSGCKIENVTIDCMEAEYGCCPDGTPAEGPFKKGCTLPCEFTTFGCCDDGITPANGTNKLNCIITPECETSEFGCCPDGKTPASKFGDICEPDCVNTQFGCCMDSVTAASGPNMEGCELLDDSIKIQDPCFTDVEGSGWNMSCSENVTVITSIVSSDCLDSNSTSDECNATDCKFTSFGCCPDNVTFAQGFDFEGCPCEQLPFGCCPDDKTPAKGESYYGCDCHHYPHGCCQDGYTPASGPHFDGCDCERMLYGCCEDKVTPASGHNMEGCGCKNSRYGCCPDNVTAAAGPNYECCPCQSMPYGCCPDQFHVAQGPENYGCPCISLPDGCCPDGQTPAKGPMYFGCECENTPYGCCLDGKTVSIGPNFEGCPGGPALDLLQSSEACSLPKERGSCSNYTVKWFFDMDYGGCTRFWYGGCKGNANRFKSEDECKSICVHPEEPAICRLPKVVGSCKDRIYMYYFDYQNLRCEPFVYSGCLGNKNKFSSKSECEDFCFRSASVDRCEQPPLYGRCKASILRWYYDKNDRVCKKLIYSGCHGNSNNFMTQNECEAACITRDFDPSKICKLPKAQGSCLLNLPRWYFNIITRRCEEFVYTGCGGNKNSFIDRESCEQFCLGGYTPTRDLHRDICTLEADPGPCRQSTLRWRYDYRQQRCIQFYYGGCEGNENNFESREQCESVCYYPSTLTSISAPGTTLTSEIITSPMPSEFSCQLEFDPGKCSDFHERWYFNINERRCLSFYYGGCGGNTNNFRDYNECESVCRRFIQTPTVSISMDESNDTSACFLNFDHGPCTNSELYWFYNHEDGVCKQFYYGGCGGNLNRFTSNEMCQKKCWRSQNICNLPKVRGSCSKTFFQWYYDGKGECKEFIYTGCEGNANRFDTREECLRQCNPEHPGTNEVAVNKMICMLPVDMGSCNGYLRRFYYSSTENVCKPFFYGGCNGNANRFETIENCEYTCVNKYGNGIPSINFTTPNILHETLTREPVRVEARIITERYKLGSQLQIDCIVTDRSSRVSWYHNDPRNIIFSNDRIEILSNNTLIIRSLKKSDSGNYTCTAFIDENNNASQTVRVDVSDIMVPSKCVDIFTYSFCSQVVETNYCSNTGYSLYCCRSCFLARQLN